jgi:putative addiction module CopG family antidote
MEITLSAEDQKLIDDLVAKGDFASANDVINAALTMLQKEEQWRAYVRAAIDEGMEAAERGDFVEQEEVEKMLQSFMRKSS